MNAPQHVEPSRSKAQIAKWILRLVAGLLLLLVLIRFSGDEKILAALRAVSPQVLLASVLFYWFGQILSAFKWQLLLRAQGALIPLRECCRLYLVGMFCNLWLPTNIGGDAVRALLVAPRCKNATIAVTSILVERLTGFLALLLIGFVAFLLDALSQRATSQNLSPSLVFARATTALMIFCIFFWFSRRFAYALSTHKTPHKIVRKWAGLHHALDEYASPQRRTVLLLSMLLSLIFQGSHVLLNLALARVVGLDIGAVTMCWLVPMLALASLLPIGIGGLGVREAAAVKLLASTAGIAGAGVFAVTVIAWSLLWQATVWLSSLPGALWWSTSSNAKHATSEE